MITLAAGCPLRHDPLAVELVAAVVAAVATCDPAPTVTNTLSEPDWVAAWAGRRVWLAAVGKAAGAMALGAVAALTEEEVRPAGGLVVVPDGAPVDESALAAAGLVLRRSAHPEPDERSVGAGHDLLGLARGCAADDVLIVLVSGGASALVCVPSAGWTLEAKRERIRALATGGADIAALNQARREMSAIKGGRLAAACAAPVLTLVASDVPGDDPAVVGSGPTVPGRPGDRLAVIAGLGRLRHAAASAVRARDRVVEVAGDDLVGDVEEVAARLMAATAGLAAGTVWIGGGEWTVALGPSPGRGGRARQLALLLARALAGDRARIAVVAASDGVDGSGPSAGAVVDGATWARLAAAGIDGDRALASHDAGTALAAIGCELASGPTGVNHADLVLIAAREHAG